MLMLSSSCNWLTSAAVSQPDSSLVLLSAIANALTFSSDQSAGMRTACTSFQPSVCAACTVPLPVTTLFWAVITTGLRCPKWSSELAIASILRWSCLRTLSGSSSSLLMLIFSVSMFCSLAEKLEFRGYLRKDVVRGLALPRTSELPHPASYLQGGLWHKAGGRTKQTFCWCLLFP